MTKQLKFTLHEPLASTDPFDSFSTHYSKDTGHKWFLEDAFQNEYRMHPGGKWLPTTDAPWTDIVSTIYNMSRSVLSYMW